MILVIKVDVKATFGVVRRFHYVYDLFASGGLILLINKSIRQRIRLTDLFVEREK